MMTITKEEAEEIDIVKNVFQRVYDNLTNKDLL